MNKSTTASIRVVTIYGAAYSTDSLIRATRAVINGCPNDNTSLRNAVLQAVMRCVTEKHLGPGWHYIGRYINSQCAHGSWTRYAVMASNGDSSKEFHLTIYKRELDDAYNAVKRLMDE